MKQNLEHNRSDKKELPERKIGENKSKIDLCPTINIPNLWPIFSI